MLRQKNVINVIKNVINVHVIIFPELPTQHVLIASKKLLTL